ncbi:MAG: hypothetical protein AAF702_04340 [Chloroflexota bacterium]
MILIQGNQINLRDWRLDDLPDYAHWQHPEHAWHQLDGPTTTDPNQKIYRL